ncbi:(4Fe-4S)-binding protein [Nocardia sp. NBC_00511]|uniref:(4Fe-4S)-binding protein n=1 Tax=Nocardia sp. NBC_00511 TaxID=2903591 RepID=UPI0030E2F1EA
MSDIVREDQPEPRPAIREYPAPGIVITWEAQRCKHAAECVHGLPSVFDRDRRPWIDPAAATVDEIVTVIDRCPSYALGYRADDGRVRTAPAE